MDLQEQIAKLKPLDDNKIATVVDGPLMGEKAVYVNHELLACSGEREFFLSLAQTEAEVKECTTIWMGENQVFWEWVRPQPKMVICGAGHVSIPVIKIANMLDFEVTVIEDRPMFANHARSAGAKTVICDNFSDALDKIEGDTNTYFVIVTRGHRYDVLCLEKILNKRHAYIGMIGSKVRVRTVKQLMIDEGYKQEQMDELHSPIGLSIKAESPAEIAVSIMAEVIKVKNECQSETGYSHEILKYLREERTEDGHAAMVTIIDRKGSAPRGIGTKMIVTQEGRSIGTIGGGCAEASIQGEALRVIRQRKPIRIPVDMTGKEAEEDGMVCGGIIDTFIELI